MKPTYTLKQILLVCFLFVFATDLLGQCISDYTKNQSSVGSCEAVGIQFLNSSTGAVRRAWNFGDGSALSGTVSPFHTFTASGTSVTYNGSLSITCTGGVVSTKSFSVTVNAKPTASFTKNKLEACSFSDIVTFKSNNIDVNNTYLWDFGDNATSTDAIANHTFYYGAKFPVTLKVTSSNGCSNTRTDSILVKPSPNPDFNLNTSEGCVPLEVQVTNVTPSSADSITSWKWDYGDGSIVNVKKPGSKLYSTAGDYSLVLYATNTLGCTNITNLPISVSDKPTIAGIAAPSGACPNQLVTLSMISPTTGAGYSWQLGNGAEIIGNSNGTSINVKWTVGGIKNIRAIVTNNTCSDFKEVLIYVSPELNPYVFYSDGKSAACKGSSKDVTIFPLSLAGYTFQNKANNTIVQQGLVNTLNFNLLNANINYDVLVKDDFGCVFTANPGVKISVYEIPNVTITSNLTSTSDICFNNPVTYTTNTSISGLNYSFFYGDTLAQSGTSPIFNTNLKLYKNTVYVQADNNGCTANSNVINLFTRDPINLPVLNCGQSGDDFVVAKWTPSVSVTGYEIEVNGASYAPPSSGSLGLSHTVTGLTVGDSILLKVKAFTSSDCEPIVYSKVAKCYAVKCEEISATIVSDKNFYCHGDTALLIAKNFISITTSLGITWSNGFQGDSLWIKLNTPGDKYLAELSIRDSGQSLKCPLYKVSKTINKNPELNFKITSTTLEYNDLRINPYACIKKKVKLSVTPATYNTYNFYLDSLGEKSTLLQSSSSPDFILMDSITQKIGSIKVEVFDAVCSNIKFLEKPCMQLLLSSDLPRCIKKGTDTTNNSFWATIGYDYYYFYDRSMPVGSQLIYQGNEAITNYIVKNRFAIIQVVAVLGKDTIIAAPRQFQYDLYPELQVLPKQNDVVCGYLDIEIQPFPFNSSYQYDFVRDLYTYKIGLPIQNPQLLTYSLTDYEKSPYIFYVNASRNGCTTTVPLVFDDKRFIVDGFNTKVGKDTLLCNSDFDVVPDISDHEVYHFLPKYYGMSNYNPYPYPYKPYEQKNYKYISYRWSTGDTTLALPINHKDTDRNKSIIYTFTRKSDGCVRSDTAINILPKLVKHERLDLKLCINQDSLNLVSYYNHNFPLKATHTWSRETWIKNPLKDTLVFPKEVSNYKFQDTVCTYVNGLEGQNQILTLYKIKDISPYSLCTIYCGKDPIVPNVITPNGDESNEYWVLKEFNQKVKISIYNRWGEEVFKNDDYKNDWNGKATGGKDLANGVYFYVIQPEGGSFYTGTNSNFTPAFSCEAKPYTDLKGTLLIER